VGSDAISGPFCHFNQDVTAIRTSSAPHEAGRGQNLVGQLRRQGMLGQRLLPGSKIVDRQHDVRVLHDVLIARGIQDDVLNLSVAYIRQHLC
jgi:hypothetical protein